MMNLLKKTKFVLQKIDYEEKRKNDESSEQRDRRRAKIRGYNNMRNTKWQNESRVEKKARLQKHLERKSPGAKNQLPQKS